MSNNVAKLVSYGGWKRARVSLLVLFVLSCTPAAALWAQSAGSANADLPAAVIINDEGGPVQISGEVSYSNVFFTEGVAAPMVILEDQAGFVDRDESYVFPVESQTLGQITSDFYTSPFSYSIALPIEPQGALRDVDQNDATDTGVMVFAVAYWTNTFGDPFLERRDLFGGGWSTAYASTRVSTDIETKREIVGGTFLVYAPDDQQGFPSGFGADGLLFTPDDPIVRLPQGYTVVNMDVTPFVFDRARHPTIDLVEPKSAATDDFSQLSYTDAFDAMIAKLRKEYAFTDYKHIDWDARVAEFRPRFELAQAQNDKRLYRQALHDFAVSIPDGHVSGPFLVDEFRGATSGGIGIAIRELDDGRVIVNFLLEDGPAARAGIQLGAEIWAIDDKEIRMAIAEVQPWSAPFSTEHVKRLQQLRYLVRSPIGAKRTVTFRNPGQPADTPSQRVVLTAVSEQASFRFSALRRQPTGFELPLEYRLLESGYGYVQIYKFSDNELLTIQLWERLIQSLKAENTPGLIIDMRQNTGGSGFLADQMAAYFYSETHDLGNAGYYNENLDDFYFDPRTTDHYYLPPEDLRYGGKLAVLIGPDCNSACEFFSYDLTIGHRAAIVGQYPTAGLGGSIDVFIMPENERFQYTAGRSVDMNGQIHIEGQGVAPTVRVPVTEETLLGDGDPVLEAAIAYLDGNLHETAAPAPAAQAAQNASTEDAAPEPAGADTNVPVDAATPVTETTALTDTTALTGTRALTATTPLTNTQPLTVADIATVEAATATAQAATEVAAEATAQATPIVTTIVTATDGVTVTAPLSDTVLSDTVSGASTDSDGSTGENQPVAPTAVPDDAGAATEANDAAPADAAPAIGSATVTTNGARLRLRAEPSRRAAIVGYAASGATYDVL
ncbi:MAG: hypothetical protein KDE50_06295, partial [Caldilineaceae bacterium]|nr:hypothetical protein [Caldilineaceae bacterium]